MHCHDSFTRAIARFLLGSLALAAGLFTGAQAAAGDLYVSTTGSDDGDGSAIAPFRTVAKAAMAAIPGTTVHVAPGAYVGSVVTRTSGTAEERIRYVSEVKWGARIAPQATMNVWSDNIAWLNTGDFVDIDGFDVDGTNGTLWHHGIVIQGSNTTVINNHVHHIANAVPCTDQGGSAINTTHYALGVNADVIGNVVHHIGYPACAYIHGIYIGTSGQVKNNLLYAVGSVGIHLWHDATRVAITNNTVFNSGVGIIVGSGDYYYATSPVSDTLVENNIVFDNSHGVAERGLQGDNITYSNNLVFQNRLFNWDTRTMPVGTVEADPLFVRYDPQGAGDYHLQADSPAVDGGLVSAAPGVDIIGTFRPLGTGVDIGAFESH